ncbi:MAG: hypothetical protein PHS37_02835 [Candidatus Omnitrophica bacterium]|nr:hypothetical protein [Candidatus Omnitrophota bacterium]
MIANDGRKELYRTLRVLGLGTMIPFALLAGPLGGFFLGNYVMARFSAPRPVFYALVITGFAGSMMEVFRIIKAMIRTEKKIP